ncbi:MAG: hypothetical protein Ta2D_10390 [Rickettsiales bacterium]|nr:MAG: hypothetical protein Ta2D_10390 [Rickettsiales bacterium]
MAKKQKKIYKRNNWTKIRGFLLYIFLSIIFVFSSYLLYKTYLKMAHKVAETYIDVFLKDSCYNFEIIGVKKGNEEKIKREINFFCNFDNISKLDALFFKIKKDPWIKKLEINRNLKNNSLKIEIKEYVPFVILIQDGKNILIDENGDEIKINKYDLDNIKDDFIKISGENAKNILQPLINLLSSNPEQMQKIRYITRVGNHRWNFELYNGIIVMMPENGIVAAWNRLDKILNTENSEKNLISIDLRNSEKTYLEWK